MTDELLQQLGSTVLAVTWRITKEAFLQHRRVACEEVQSWANTKKVVRMKNGIANAVLALALLGGCTLGQNQGQSRSVASVPDMTADKPSSTTSLRQWVESGERIPIAINQPSPYFWKTAPVGNSAQLLTLFCKACNVLEQDVPLVSVLRDTLGDETEENDRVTYVWLLTYARPRVRERLLSAVPFFYWRVSKASGSMSERDMAPLMDLSAPENPMMSGIERNLIQWTAFDPLSTPARA